MFKLAALLIIVVFLSLEARALRFKALEISPEARGFQKVYDYKFQRNRLMKDTIIVKFKTEAKKSDMDHFALVNNLKFLNKLNNKTLVYKITNLDILNFADDQNFLDTYQILNLDLDEYKHLSHSKKIISKSPSLVKDQWHLMNTHASSNVEEAWKYTKGAGIIVAVIDSGFDLDHPDINYASLGYDAQTGSMTAAAADTSSENHGTAVAGLIAARDDGIGVVGVAPEAKILPIRLYGDDGMVSSSQIIRAHLKAVELGATIINNSWGTYDPRLAQGESLEISEQEIELYNNLATEANDGKGVVVIFASGNSARKDPGFNNSPEARLEANLAVGATNKNNERAYYSIYGDALDLVAPGGDSFGGIYTTDRQDLAVKISNKTRRYVLGYDKGSYTSNFIGTSAAAPIVSGLAALVWSANPQLSADEVKGIIIDTCKKDINSKYKFDSEGKNSELGAGLVDAGAAVIKALNF